MFKNIMLMSGALLLASAGVASAEPGHHGYHDRDYRYHGWDRHDRRSTTVLSLNFGGNWGRPYYSRPHYYRPVTYVEQPVFISGPPMLVAPPAPQMADNDRYCREYQTQTRVGGSWRQSYGTACYQPDGSWQLMN